VKRLVALGIAVGGLAVALVAGAQSRGPESADRDKAGRATRNQQPVTVNADKMERLGKESLVIFTGNVIGRQNGSVQYAERMEVYLDEKGDRILRTVSTGNVRIITRDDRTGTARRAEYDDLEQRVVLTGSARVWQDDNAVSGESVVIFLAEDRSVVQGGSEERVKTILFPRDDTRGGRAGAGPVLAAAARTTGGAETKGGAETSDKSAARPNRSQPVTVDSDKMERFGKESLVVFTGNVVARQDNSVQYADRMEVYLDEKGDRILRTISTGNVRIVTRDCRTGTARRAEYHDLEQRVVLSGNARVWQDDNTVSGDSVVIYLSQDRSVVQSGNQERVQAIFHPREGKKDGAPAARKPASQCAN
jgi:lipopolysaccharide export system protein LptA